MKDYYRFTYNDFQPWVDLYACIGMWHWFALFMLFMTHLLDSKLQREGENMVLSFNFVHWETHCRTFTVCEHLQIFPLIWRYGAKTRSFLHVSKISHRSKSHINDATYSLHEQTVHAWCLIRFMNIKLS